LGKGQKVSANLSIGKHDVIAKYSDGSACTKALVTLEVVETPEHLFVREEVEHKDRINKVKDQDGAILIVNKDKGIITDTSTNLMWMRAPVSYKYSYYKACQYANSCDFAGYNDWRLPTFKELADISNLYYDGRDCVPHREFISSEGKFWTSDIYSKEVAGGKCAYAIKYTGNPVRNYAYYAEQTLANLKAPSYLRLVRNAN
jgi:hypothetical protein